MPDAVGADLHRQLAPYRRAHPDVRWTSPETWHLTLLFLGSVAPDRTAELERLVDGVAATVEPYDVAVDKGGGRSHRGEGVAWLGLSAGASTLIETATLTAGRYAADITIGASPKRTPSAHLTVARRANEEVMKALHDQAHGPLGVEWTVDRVQLVRSHLEPAGARYETLHEGAL